MKTDQRSKFSNLSNWKEEARKNQAVQIYELFHIYTVRKTDHRSKFSNLSNWKEEARKNQAVQIYELFHIYTVLHIISLLTGDMNSIN